MRWLLSLLVLFAPLSLCAQDDLPRSLDERLTISLFAEDPLLNTPTGIDVDHTGRVWVIESNTHFPPAGYKGHPTDRLLILKDTNGDGTAEAKVFADGFTHSMSVAARPIWLDPVSFVENDNPEELKKRTQVYLATRREILLLEDTDGDNVCDKQARLVHLETEGNYPHNGLAGFAFDGLGNMYFGFGENLGADYKIIGRDGTTYSGGGEGGNIYQVQPDGTKLTHWATGFWNPHANCVDAFGRLFSVDNDPDSLPPCRLLHIIEGGDYGYRFRNGRKGLHPFTAWNGEIPGTLPMVAGTGEAPSGILAYEHDAFPEEYLGNLIVTSWGDHRIDQFQLQKKGASFESVAEPFIVGGENFRPVGIALAPDGSLFVSDWVLRDYKLHGKGRVWRIAPKEDMTGQKSEQMTEEQKLASSYLVERRRAARTLSQTEPGKQSLLRVLGDVESSARSQVEALWALANLPEGALPENTFVPKRDEKGKIIGGRKIATDNREVFLTTLSLMGTTHFPVPTSPIELNLDLGLFNSHQTLSDNNGKVGLPADYLLAIYPLFEKLRFNVSVPLPSEDPSTTQRDASLKEATNRFAFALFLIELFNSNDSFVNSTVLRTLLKSSEAGTVTDISRRLLLDQAEQTLRNEPNKLQPSGTSYQKQQYQQFISFLILYLRESDPRDFELAKNALKLPRPIFKRLAVQWIAEENLTELRPEVEALFADPDLTPDLFLATLAALEILDGKPPQEFDKTPPGKYVLPILKDESKPDNVRAIALRLVDPHDPELDEMLLRELMKSDDPALRREAIRTAMMNPSGVDYCGLLVVLDSEDLDDDLRAEALVGIARRIGDSRNAQHTIGEFAKSDNPIFAREALRALREPSNERPQEPFPIEEKPDYNAGRRLFFHPNGPGCYKCHMVEGRGGNIGPDLTNIGAALSREKLLESIQKPSQEVAPQFTSWSMISTDGKAYTGMIVHENEGDTTLGLKDGTTIKLKTAEVEERSPQKTSIMPEKLEQQMTEREFEDLLAFLESLK